MRNIPGTVEVAGREFIYVQVLHEETFFKLIDAAIASCPDARTPESGGVIGELVRIILPGGQCLLGLSSKGDLSGWSGKPIGYCREQGRIWMRIQPRRSTTSCCIMAICAAGPPKAVSPSRRNSSATAVCEGRLPDGMGFSGGADTLMKEGFPPLLPGTESPRQQKTSVLRTRMPYASARRLFFQTGFPNLWREL